MKNEYQVIDSILLTEKGTILAEEQNKYIFRVHPDANKNEVRNAVQKLFQVNVVGVNTMNRKGKLKRERTRHYGRTAAWKKAVVTLAEGQSIDLT